ncbi:MAG: hypothetical protein LGR52_14120 [Candidatus Thiosymbion ectosymbiont of Robbea hypermnestra]|nr:hypothetical protein [Candidatus Thiosymbion ectosymbiont of Robbea hypermnestra]
MGEIDEVKEFLGYLKIIFALVLATTIGLIGWLVQNYKKTEPILELYRPNIIRVQ